MMITCAILGIILGWILNMAYSPVPKMKAQLLIVSLIIQANEDKKKLQKQEEVIVDLSARLELMKALNKGLNGLPYATKNR